MITPKKLIKNVAHYLGFEIHRRPKPAKSLQYGSTIIKELDLSKVELIRNSSIDELRDLHFVEDLLLKLGLNDELLSEFPKELYQYTGYGYGIKLVF